LIEETVANWPGQQSRPRRESTSALAISFGRAARPEPTCAIDPPALLTVSEEANRPHRHPNTAVSPRSPRFVAPSRPLSVRHIVAAVARPRREACFLDDRGHLRRCERWVRISCAPTCVRLRNRSLVESVGEPWPSESARGSRGCRDRLRPVVGELKGDDVKVHVNTDCPKCFTTGRLRPQCPRLKGHFRTILVCRTVSPVSADPLSRRP
jgi:hypothetical protein